MGTGTVTSIFGRVTYSAPHLGHLSPVQPGSIFPPLVISTVPGTTSASFFLHSQCGTLGCRAVQRTSAIALTGRESGD